MAKKRGKVLGLKKVMKNLNKETRKISMGTQEGVHAAALIIKAESLRRTPVDTGNLRGAAFTKSGSGILRPWAVVGYDQSTNYAIFVHENMDVHHPTGEAKFLENAVMAKKMEVLAIIKKLASVK